MVYFFPNYMQAILLSQIDLNTWLWKEKMQCSSSAMTISKAGKNGMQAELLCLTRSQNVGGTKCHSENVPSLPAFGSTQVLCCTRQPRREDVHLNIQKRIY